MTRLFVIRRCEAPGGLGVGSTFMENDMLGYRIGDYSWHTQTGKSDKADEEVVPVAPGTSQGDPPIPAVSGQPRLDSWANASAADNDVIVVDNNDEPQVETVAKVPRAWHVLSKA